MKISEENCHPFIITQDSEGNPTSVFGHNGSITSHREYQSDQSDTHHFNEKVLKEIAKDVPINPDSEWNETNWWKNYGFVQLIESAIGSGNKLVFLNNSGDIEIYNEHLGEWFDVDGETDEQKHQIWFSNTDYKTVRKRGR